jgi:hypothetical protein
VFALPGGFVLPLRLLSLQRHWNMRRRELLGIRKWENLIVYLVPCRFILFGRMQIAARRWPVQERFLLESWKW